MPRAAPARRSARTASIHTRQNSASVIGRGRATRRRRGCTASPGRGRRARRTPRAGAAASRTSGRSTGRPVTTTRSAGTPCRSHRLLLLHVVPDRDQVGDDPEQLLARQVVPARDADRGGDAGGRGAARVVDVGRARHQVRRDEDDVGRRSAGRAPARRGSPGSRRSQQVEHASPTSAAPGADVVPGRRMRSRNVRGARRRARWSEVRDTVLADLEEVDVVERAADRPRDPEPAVRRHASGLSSSGSEDAAPSAQPRLLDRPRRRLLALEDEVHGVAALEHLADHGVEEPQVAARGTP